jgi:hypothetical protein
MLNISSFFIKRGIFWKWVVDAYKERVDLDLIGAWIGSVRGQGKEEYLSCMYVRLRRVMDLHVAFMKLTWGTVDNN